MYTLWVANIPVPPPLINSPAVRKSEEGTSGCADGCRIVRLTCEKDCKQPSNLQLYGLSLSWTRWCFCIEEYWAKVLWQIELKNQGLKIHSKIKLSTELGRWSLVFAQIFLKSAIAEFFSLETHRILTRCRVSRQCESFHVPSGFSCRKIISRSFAPRSEIFSSLRYSFSRLYYITL